LQAASDSQRRYWQGVESRLVFWLAVIALTVVLCAGAFGLKDGLVIGAVLAGFVVVGRAYLWTWFMRKRMNRVDKFRKRFRKLLDSVNDIRWQTRPEEMVAEDKAFLEEYKNTVLFPSTIPGIGNGVPSDRDLAHIETLYLEYGPSWRHVHPWPDPNDPNSNTKLKCELCMTADRVRKHIEGAISSYEAAIASARQELAARIDNANADGALDAKAFFDEFSKRKAFYYVPEDLAEGNEKLLGWLNSLCDKQRWTFDEADKVRELCRTRAKGESHWLEPYEQEGRFDQLVGKLTQGMKSAATTCGLPDTWDWYDSAKQRLALNEGVINDVRRILGRHSPTAMFRELEEEFGGASMDTLHSVRFPGITNYGYDPQFVTKERKLAAKLLSRERDKYDREIDGQLRAVKAFLRAETRAGE